MRLMRYAVSDGCHMTEVESIRPRWAEYVEAEQQLADIVKIVNGRIGNAVRAAWFDAAKPVVKVELLYADSIMVTSVFQNGALERELTGITTRFGYRVDKVETNIGEFTVGEQPTLDIVMSKVPHFTEQKPKTSGKKPKASGKKPKASGKKPKASGKKPKASGKKA